MKKFVFLTCFIVISTVLFGQINVSSGEIKNHVGQIVSICDRIVDAKFLENAITKPTLLNVGGAYPNHLYTIVINFENRGNFSFKPEEYYLSKRVCITGKVVDFKGKPQIVVLSPAEIIINEDETQSSPRTQGTSGRTVVATPSPIVNTPASKVATPPNTAAISSPSQNISNNAGQTASTALKKTNMAVPVQVNSSNKVIADTAKTNNANSFEVYDVKLTADVNVRMGPANTFEVLEVLKPGTTVTILNSENGWSNVSYQKYSQEQLRPVVLKGYIKNSVLK